MQNLTPYSKIRHKKCDEAKPTCLRCRTDRVVCDGYAEIKPSGKSRAVTKTKAASTLPNQARKLVIQPPLTLLYHDTSSEARFFHHFTSFTSLELSECPELLDMWRLVALPFAYQDDTVMRTMAAVGAAHQWFTCRGTPNVPPQVVIDLLFSSLSLYNDAITRLIGSSSLAPETVLLCCLLFICYENMVGRYRESLKHLRAGIRLLNGQNFSSGVANSALMQAIFNLFAHVGVDFSILMDDQLLPSWTTRALITASNTHLLENTPFVSLSEAANELQQLDLEGMHSMSFETDCRNYPWPNEAALVVNARVKTWCKRLDLTAAAMSRKPIAPHEERRLANLRLQQGIWLMAMHFDDPVKDQVSTDKDCEFFYQYAEPLGKRIISLQRPTFSGDGTLISGLSLLISMTSNKDLQERACRMLEALNRREGGWDSRDVAQMHRAELAEEDPDKLCDEYEMTGIPNYIQKLSLRSKAITPDNGLLQLAIESSPLHNGVQDYGTFQD